MSTKIYGASDDLIEVEGDASGEVGFYSTDDDDNHGVLLVCSDGTLLTVKYGTTLGGIWQINLVQAGALFNGIDTCTDEDEEPNSDVAHFRDGLKWVIAATEWEKVK